MVEMLIPLRLNHPRVKAKKHPTGNQPGNWNFTIGSTNPGIRKKSCYRVIKKPKILLPNQNNSTESPGTVSKDPSREASELAEIQSRGGKSEQQIQTKVTKARQTGEEIRSQALSQKSAVTTDPKQIQLEAKLARKAEIKKQRDDYESMIKANFNRFQKSDIGRCITTG